MKRHKPLSAVPFELILGQMASPVAELIRAMRHTPPLVQCQTARLLLDSALPSTERERWLLEAFLSYVLHETPGMLVTGPAKRHHRCRHVRLCKQLAQS